MMYDQVAELIGQAVAPLRKELGELKINIELLLDKEEAQLSAFKGLLAKVNSLQDENTNLRDQIDDIEARTRGMDETVTSTREEVSRMRDDVHFNNESFISVSTDLNEHVHADKSIRRRSHASTSVKGIKKIEGTVETTGYTEEEHWAAWDAHDDAIESRQPVGRE